jgi:alkylation response protein AidB-like acyl-CoA dehydrogenase
MTRAHPRTAGPERRVSLLDLAPPEPFAPPRTAETVTAELRELHQRGELDLPLPGNGQTDARWAALARLGRRDLCLARLAEGHADAVAILAEAGRAPQTKVLYGVWASRSRGTGAVVRRRGRKWHLAGKIRFCSGAGYLDRALVAAVPVDSEESLLLEVDLADRRIEPDPDSWPALGMDASASLAVTIHDLVLAEESIIGPVGFYAGRCGFSLGGAGVAAVWLGGAAGAFDTALTAVTPGLAVDPHRLAQLGVLHTQLASTDALLALAAETIDSAPGGDHDLLVATCRSAAERAAREVIDVVPRIVGPGPLCWDRRLSRHLADLQVYIRQHHAEADLAALGSAFLACRAQSSYSSPTGASL